MKNKKTKRKLYTTKQGNDYEASKIIRITIAVILVLGLTYFVTALATGEIKFKSNKDKVVEEVSIQYEELIAGQIFNRKSDNYYVMLFNFTDVFASYYLSLKDAYEKDKDIPIYIVDLEKDFNTNIVLKEDQNFIEKPSKLEDLKVSDPTMIKISKGKVTERIVGREKIIEFLDTED